MKTEARAQPIKHLLLVEELQTREELTLDAVADYAMCYAAKDGDGFAELPPVEAFDVGGDLHVINGHHRIAGALKAGAEFIRVDVVGSGTLDEARWAAASKNKANGVHRSGADKRRAIRMALDSEIGCEQSSRTIAEHVGVSKDLVGEVRAEWEAANSASIGGKANGTVTTKDGRQYPKHRSEAAKERQKRKPAESVSAGLREAVDDEEAEPKKAKPSTPSARYAQAGRMIERLHQKLTGLLGDDDQICDRLRELYFATREREKAA